MTEDELVSQMRTTISAGYETVSAIVAVRFMTFFILRRNSFMLFSGYCTKLPATRISRNNFAKKFAPSQTLLSTS